jgi:hypothetical protein
MLYISYYEEIHMTKMEMIMMGKIKDLLGDMDVEEFEVRRRSVLDKVKDLNVDEFIGLCCEDVTAFYDCWLEIGGRYIAGKHMITHYGGRILIDEVDDFIHHLLKRFIGWLESF